jgi:hypothetical protein
VLDWFDAEFNEALAEDFAELFSLVVEFAADQVPFVEALFLLDESYPDAQEFGYNGEFNNVMLRTERDVKRLWDIPSDDILLLAMKGTMLQDEARSAAVYEQFFVDGPGDPITPAVGFKVIGFADVAPQAIYAHEFAHHIQYENDYFDVVPPTYPGGPAANTQAEFTRYTELMADAPAAYQPRASEFGFRLADEARKQGHILTSEQFHDLFVDEYPTLVAPDAT